jgi:hypothetical protein
LADRAGASSREAPPGTVTGGGKPDTGFQAGEIFGSDRIKRRRQSRRRLRAGARGVVVTSHPGTAGAVQRHATPGFQAMSARRGDERDNRAMPKPTDPEWNRVDTARRHLVAVGWLHGAAKLCTIQFHKDGYFVHFPFQPHTNGLLAFCNVRAGVNEVSLVEHGALVSHRVKYSHHGDGTCLFSQDGKIRSVVRTNQGLRLDRPSPDRSGVHVFSIDVQGLNDFAPMAPEERFSDRVGRGYFDVMADRPPALHLVARWIRIDRLVPVEALRNPVEARLPTGDSTENLAISPPKSSPLYGHVMLLNLSVRDWLGTEEDNPVQLMFTGGFGPNLSDPNVDSSALVMIYPAEHSGFDLPTADYVN